LVAVAVAVKVKPVEVAVVDLFRDLHQYYRDNSSL
jgi:hypothetical protein